ncbi:MAG TPA: hypothetical protein VF584_03380 [Longimicrobium sp.]|jgi:hypothetical protein
MTQLSLDTDGAAVLADALRSYLSDLHDEIAGTDNFDFREALKRREQMLTGILHQIQSGQELPPQL